MVYRVEISELLCRNEYIEADDAETAEKIARDRYSNNEIVLTADDYVDGSVQIEATGVRQ